MSHLFSLVRPLTSALSGDGFCAGAFKLSSERASGHGRNFVAVYSRASELHFVPWMHVEALEGGFADQATKMGKLDRAYETLLKAILVGSLEAINDPLIELVTIS